MFSLIKIVEWTGPVLESTGAIENLCKQSGTGRPGPNHSSIFIYVAVLCLTLSLGAWWDVAGFVWVHWAEGLRGYAVPPGKVECTVGNKALLTLGLFPGQVFFQGELISSATWGEKTYPLERENKKNLPRRPQTNLESTILSTVAKKKKALKLKSVFLDSRTW